MRGAEWLNLDLYGNIRVHFCIIYNLIWIIYGGLFSTIGRWIAGILRCITIIGIPIGCGRMYLVPLIWKKIMYREE